MPERNPIPDTLQARRLILLDPAGRHRIILAGGLAEDPGCGPILLMQDAVGRPALTAKIPDNDSRGGPRLQLHGRPGEPSIRLSLAPDAAPPGRDAPAAADAPRLAMVELLAADGLPVATLYATGGGKATLALGGGPSAPAALLTAGPGVVVFGLAPPGSSAPRLTLTLADGTPTIALLDARGVIRLSLAVSAQGPSLTVHDENGTAIPGACLPLALDALRSDLAALSPPPPDLPRETKPQ